MEPERIATNTYDFENIRTTGLTYVDKTAVLYPLVNGSIGNQFFLARPRRFGKSLLVSTIQKLFEGRRDLFGGLAIDSLPWDWSASWPVLRLDMSLCSGETVDEVETAVWATLRREAERLGDKAFARLVNMYDGYCFDDSLTRVFNPVSLGRCLDSADMRSYWFETGTPGWLISYARKAPIDVDNLYLGDADLGTFEPANPSMPAVLFQTGYLTIKDVWGQDVGTMYRLGFPNKEVAAAFNLLFSEERAA